VSNAFVVLVETVTPTGIVLFRDAHHFAVPDHIDVDAKLGVGLALLWAEQFIERKSAELEIAERASKEAAE